MKLSTAKILTPAILLYICSFTELVGASTLLTPPQKNTPGISQVAPMTKTEVLEKVAEFQPLRIPEACVINSLLFSSWFKKNIPNNWNDQAVIPVYKNKKSIGSKIESDVLYHHRVTLFKAGQQDFVYDQTYGALPLPGRNYASTAAKVKDAMLVVNAASHRIYEANGYGAQPREVAQKRAKKPCEAAYSEMNGSYAVAEIEYLGKRVIAFREDTAEGTKLAIYTPDRGTIQTLPLLVPQTEVEANKLMSSMLRQFSGGNGDFKTVQGNFFGYETNNMGKASTFTAVQSSSNHNAPSLD